jgi:hypothetical protein
MSSLNFYQLYPYQKTPKLATDTSYKLPKRADFFCHPFKTAAKKGVFAYAPFEFSIKVTDAHLDFEAQRPDKTTFHKRVEKKPGAANFVLLSDIDQERSEECLKKYRARIDKNAIPDNIDAGTFGFYEIMVNIIVEEDPFDFYLQIWLGGSLELDSNGQILVKHATNVLNDAGFICLDAEIDTQLWQGWLAIVIKPTRKNEWIHVNSDTPICQILGVSEPIQSLRCLSFDKISDKQFQTPLDWHLFDTEYAAKPGKYMRQIKKKNKA